MKRLNKMTKKQLDAYTVMYCWICGGKIDRRSKFFLSFSYPYCFYLAKHMGCWSKEDEVLAIEDDQDFLYDCDDCHELDDFRRYD